MSIKLKDTIYDLINNSDKLDGKDSDYFASLSSLNEYLPLSGGILSGNLSLGDTKTTTQLLLSVSRDNIKSSLLISGAKEGWYLTSYEDGNSTALIQNETSGLIYKNTSGSYYTILHTGNYSSYAATKDHTHTGFAASSHTHNSVKDAQNSQTTTFCYSKSGLNYDEYTWLAGWNGYELRAIHKDQFAQKSQIPTSLPANGGNADTVDGYHAVSFGKIYESSNYNCNEVGTYFSVHRFSNAPTNAFPNSAYGNMLTIGSGSDTVFQLGSSYINDELYYRRGTWYSDGTGTVRTNGWKSILHSGNSSVTKSGETLTVKINGTTQSLTNTNTIYSAGAGISLSGTTFSNSGVRSIATGGNNGTISVNTNGTSANVAVKGLGSAAYTASSEYASASHTHSYLPLGGGTISGNTLHINTTETSQIGICCRMNNSNKSWIGYESGYGTVLYQYGTTAYRLGINTSGNPYYMTGTTSYGLIHSGNIGSQSVNYANSSGSASSATLSNRSKYIETVQNGSWYGDSYKMYANWETSNICKLTVDNYYTKTDYSNNANYATSAGNADTVDNVHNGDLTSKYIKDIGNGTSITVQYSGSGITSAEWICAWNGYKIDAINQSNINAGMVDGHHFSTVSSLPSSPNSSTVYFITG